MGPRAGLDMALKGLKTPWNISEDLFKIRTYNLQNTIYCFINFLTESRTHLLRIQEVTDSILGPESGYHM